MPVAGSPRLLVVYKKSQLALYREHEPGRLDEIRETEPELFARFQAAHDQNADAIEQVEAAIHRRGVTAQFLYRAEHDATDGADLVISVGGDGTLLDVSHAVLRAPLMGVNSNPGRSVGHFCTTDAENFGDALDRWLSGDLPASTLTRLQATINGHALDLPILNDVLFAHTVPAAVSRYVVCVGEHSEEHKSSGIWVATAAGSTAAIASAGGVTMAAEDTRMQYVVREPYTWAKKDHRLLSGIIDQPLKLLVKMRTAGLYLDGHREQHMLALGDRVSLGPHPVPLRLVGFSRGR